MSWIDWLVMTGTLAFIVIYGVIKTRSVDNVKSYLQGDRDLKWWTIGLSVMATQASAITFLSTPGQAYNSGMGFAQFYFGLPIAMVILCVFVLPIYYRLKVYTAYEYLEGRFDLRVRTLTALLFLIQRGLAAGITIYAPAIILSSILGWSLGWTILIIGVVVIFYTVMGGTKAVSVTQKQQMIVILAGMFIAGVVVVQQLPANVGFGDAMGVAGKLGKLEILDFNFDLNDRYNIWSALFGGTFLFLSYFGTDQSQVQRYLSGKSLAESRLGLLFNGIFKVPMQFLVLFVGVMVFVFFLFQPPPIHFNTANLDKVRQSPYATELTALENEYATVNATAGAASTALVEALRTDDAASIAGARTNLTNALAAREGLASQVDALITNVDGEAIVEDRDYVFITFIINYLPIGLVGLLLAVIFSAAMSSTSSELSALATTSLVDIYRRSLVPNREDAHYFAASKWLTMLWGAIALGFAAVANLFDNLIQAVNIIGSLFYGVILGIFAVAFFLKRVGSQAVLIAAIISQVFVAATFIASAYGVIDLAYLWLNLIGCGLTVLLALAFNGGNRREEAALGADAGAV
ncbi:sodium:solute symporter [Neolewinella lacunae]|uniref:Sodium:solute symporter n=1 Tax=Neolewinella lacunae TaxID=1517758 RepID=A0A923PJV3_9BACT|nr:sodium:solute symporter [Neolewinella lacunae]MBC6994026.1 sodium:solute symporter [Neolewinella lacunae]MDN3634696.1 sodium:solute symporter [Neolewinella lacunae]